MRTKLIFDSKPSEVYLKDKRLVLDELGTHQDYVSLKCEMETGPKRLSTLPQN